MNIMKNRMIVFSIFFILSGTAVFAGIREAGDNGQPGKAIDSTAYEIPAGPETLDAKLAAASLVVRAVVAKVEPYEKEPEKRRGSARQDKSRTRMIATLEVQYVYKGGYDGEELTVEFIRSARKEKPPLMDLRTGEETILFLVPSPNPPHYMPVNFSFGKTKFTNKIDGKLKSETGSGKSEKDTGNMTVNLASVKTRVARGEPAYLTILVMNNSRKHVRIDAALDPAIIFHVSGPGGKRLLPLPNSSRFAIDMVAIQPQHFTGARYDLAKYFDLSSPGAYKVRAIVIPDGSAAVLSGTISIIVGE